MRRKRNKESENRRQLSLAQLAVYGYDSARVKKGSWLEQQFGGKNSEVEDDGSSGQNEDDETG